MNIDFDKKFGADFIGSVPDQAGIYIFRDGMSDPIYVGKAKNLRKRLAQYRLATGKKLHRKMRAIVKEAEALEFQVCTSEREALLLENQLIQDHRPNFNVAGAYAFLYPYLGLKTDLAQPGFLTFCYTTVPDKLMPHAFELYGAFRSRETVSQAYEALMFLMPFISHYSPSERGQYGEISYTRIASFRQVEGQWLSFFQGLFRGESSAGLNELALALLEKPGARRVAADIQQHLKNLQIFFVTEASKLRRVLDQQAPEASSIAQEDRDKLFLLFDP